ncbi:MAG: SMI1/KNR4 family protein [Acidobacteriota bacterium]
MTASSFDDGLLERLRQRAASSQPTDASSRASPPPLSERELATAQQRLGFELPSDLAQLYTQVANGGFGPSHGLLGLMGGPTNEDDDDVVTLYESFREPDPDDAHWSWPERLLPVGHLGCGMFCCVDCTTREGQVTWFEPNPHVDGESWDDAFVPFAESTRAWLEAWLDGVHDDLFELAWNRKFGLES